MVSGSDNDNLVVPAMSIPNSDKTVKNKVGALERRIFTECQPLFRLKPEQQRQRQEDRVDQRKKVRRPQCRRRQSRLQRGIGSEFSPCRYGHTNRWVTASLVALLGVEHLRRDHSRQCLTRQRQQCLHQAEVERQAEPAAGFGLPNARQLALLEGSRDSRELWRCWLLLGQAWLDRRAVRVAQPTSQARRTS